MTACRCATLVLPLNRADRRRLRRRDGTTPDVLRAHRDECPFGDPPRLAGTFIPGCGRSRFRAPTTEEDDTRG